MRIGQAVLHRRQRDNCILTHALGNADKTGEGQGVRIVGCEGVRLQSSGSAIAVVTDNTESGLVSGQHFSNADNLDGYQSYCIGFDDDAKQVLGFNPLVEHHIEQLGFHQQVGIELQLGAGDDTGYRINGNVDGVFLNAPHQTIWVYFRAVAPNSRTDQIHRAVVVHERRVARQADYQTFETWTYPVDVFCYRLTPACVIHVAISGVCANQIQNITDIRHVAFHDCVVGGADLDFGARVVGVVMFVGITVIRHSRMAAAYRNGVRLI